MATSVDVAFTEFLARLALTQVQVETAAKRVTSVHQFFRGKFHLAEPVITIGSYGRGTIIRPQRDLDLLVPLSYPHYKDPYDNRSRDLLYMVRDALNAHYGSTVVSSKRVAVKVDFSDIVVDVVPCFRREGGGYLIPEGSNPYRWLATNPPFHTALMTRSDVGKANRLKPLVKLMKQWNFVNGHHLSSFHVELMIEAMWRNTSIGLYSEAVASTLKVMPSWLNSSFDDPWPEGGRSVDSYLSHAERQTAVRLLKEDAQNSELAESYRRDGRVEHAFERWGVVFRNAFPVYG